MRLSTILPIHSETDSVRETVEALLALLGDQVHEIILVVHHASPEETFKTCQELIEKHSNVKLRTQTSDGLGNALREGMRLASGTHALFMDSDGEMNPNTVPQMISKLLDEDLDMVVASRWVKGGGAEGYQPIKYVFVRLFNSLFRHLYKTSIHDLSLGFKVMRVELAKGIEWRGEYHEIATETTLRPIRLGYKVGEVPMVWTKRKARKSKNWVGANIRYLKMALDIYRGK